MLFPTISIPLGYAEEGASISINAQRDDTLLGKILRLDPSLEATPAPPFYTIPPDNPRAAAGPPLGTIWAKGLRNPWRFAFDALRGDLYIADVGQNRWEEVHVTRAGTPGGLNYGWRLMEGQACFNPATNCEAPGLERPVVVYANGNGRCAIIGGYVYRGTRLSALVGTYLYADLCSGEIFGLTEGTPGVWQSTLLLDTEPAPHDFRARHAERGVYWEMAMARCISSSPDRRRGFLVSPRTSEAPQSF